MRALCVALLLTGCGAAVARPALPPREYPGALVAPEALRSPSALGEAFALEQRVRSESPAGTHQFRAVLQLRGDTLVMVGFGPHGGRGFVLTQRGHEVALDWQLPGEIPFPPRYMMHDVQRVWFGGLEGPRPDGEHRETRGDEELVERWEGGRLRERTYRRLDGPPEGVLRVRYEPGLGGTRPPREVVLDNGWFGYRLVLTTLSHQRIEPEAD
jgi:hypothetical protein